MQQRCLTIRHRLARLHASTVTEYAIIIALVSIAGVMLLLSIGQRTGNLLDQMNSNMPR